MGEFLQGAAAFVFLTVAVSLVCVLRGPGSVERVMAILLFGTGGMAGLLMLGATHDMELVINVVLTLAVLGPFVAIAFVRASAAAVRDETRVADAKGKT